jgi:hypothetical protein
MATIKKDIDNNAVDKKTHAGYNEKNPTQPQGAFKPDAMETNDQPINTAVVKKRRSKKVLLNK